MNINFISAVAEDKYIYWLTESHGLGMRMDTITQEVSFLDIPWKDVDLIPYSNTIVAVEDGVMYGICCAGKYLMKFDIFSKKLSIIRVGLERLLLHDNVFAEKVGDEIILLPSISERMIYVDVHNGTIRDALVASYMNSKKYEYYYANIHEVIDKEMIPLFDANKNEFVLKSIISGKSIYKSFPENMMKPIYIQETDKGYYVLSTKGDVYFIDKDFYNWNCVYKYKPVDGDGRIPFCAMIVKNNILWLLPFLGERILYINLKNGIAYEFDEKPNDLKYLVDNSMSNYSNAMTLDDTTYFAMHKGNYIFSVDIKGKGRFLQTKWPSETDYLKHLFDITGIVKENESDLKTFLGILIV